MTTPEIVQLPPGQAAGLMWIERLYWTCPPPCRRGFDELGVHRRALDGLGAGALLPRCEDGADFHEATA